MRRRSSLLQALHQESSVIDENDGSEEGGLLPTEPRSGLGTLDASDTGCDGIAIGRRGPTDCRGDSFYFQ